MNYKFCDIFVKLPIKSSGSCHHLKFVSPFFHLPNTIVQESIKPHYMNSNMKEKTKLLMLPNTHYSQLSSFIITPYSFEY